MTRRMTLAGTVGVLFVVGTAYAQTPTDQIVGTWLVVSVVLEADGKKTEPFGLNPQGVFIFTVDGHYSTNIIRPGRPKFASNNRVKGSAEENKEAVAGNISSFGTYAINSDGSITLHIVGSSFPNWDGTQQRRIAQIIGDEMTYTNPTPSTGVGNAILNLKRAK